MNSQFFFAQNNPDNEVFGKEYFILDPGIKMIYESTFGETICITENNEEGYLQEFTGEDFKMLQQLNISGDHMTVSKLEQELKILFVTAHSISITYSEPAILVNFPIVKGGKSNWRGLEYTNEEEVDTITITSEFIDKETVKTTAGNFECIKLEYIITKNSGRINKYYEWRAADIGLVKLTAEVDKKGFVGLITEILGIDEISFLLKEIQD